MQSCKSKQMHPQGHVHQTDMGSNYLDFLKKLYYMEYTINKIFSG